MQLPVYKTKKMGSCKGGWDMKRDVALLKGINISGKNIVPMAKWKKCFESLAFEEVRTYCNSGNVIFSSDADDTRKFTSKIEVMIKNSLVWIFLFLSYQENCLRTFCTMYLTGGEMTIKKSMIIWFSLYRQLLFLMYIMRLESQKNRKDKKL